MVCQPGEYSCWCQRYQLLCHVPGFTIHWVMFQGLPFTYHSLRHVPGFTIHCVLFQGLPFTYHSLHHVPGFTIHCVMFQGLPFTASCSRVYRSLCHVTGFECLDKASSPVACQPGEYSLSASSSGCQTCPAGSSCPVTDASPTPCATGRCTSLHSEQMWFIKC